MKVAKILLPLSVTEPFDYISDQVELGQIVKVPFRGDQEIGVVWGNGESEVAEYKLKKIDEVLPLPLIPQTLMKFIEWVAEYNMAPVGMVLKMSIPVKFGGKRRAAPEQNVNYKPTEFSDAQNMAVEYLRNKAELHKFSTTVIDGVTGSGKTEVYFAAIERALAAGKQAVVMLPEIALSVQWLDRFEKRFGIKPGIWHSDRTAKERRETWLDVLEGKCKLIVGARSALFLPYPNLGLIVVDEEHDQSYKQEEGVTYQARDMAVMRAKLEEIPIILVSATPSIETLNNVAEGKYEKLHLPERFGGASMPKINIVDMRYEKLPGGEFISLKLRKALEDALAAKQQSVLFLNRRGYAPLTLCRACGYRVQCTRCSAWMVEHKSNGKLCCHHCGFTTKIPKKCPICGVEDKLHACGPGVERIFEEAKKTFPNANVEIMASDSPTTANEIIDRMEKHEIDILVGTQMIAKGHHFPKLALVGIVDADLGLAGGDLRALERSYQLLHQVSGRAGRELEVGSVFIQSYMPDNAVIKALLSGDRDKFLDMETKSRKEFAMPPFGRLATLTLSGKNEATVKAKISEIAVRAPKNSMVRILGPAPAPMSFLRGQHRHRIILKSPKNYNLQGYIKTMMPAKLTGGLKLRVDIDPYSFV